MDRESLFDKWEPTGLLGDLKEKSDKEDLIELLEDTVEFVADDELDHDIQRLVMYVVSKLYLTYEYDYIDLPYLIDKIINIKQYREAFPNQEEEYSGIVAETYHSDYNGGET